MADGMKRVFVTKLTDTFTTDKEGVGTIRQEGQFTYKWVKHNGTTTVAIGDALCYDLSDLAGVNPLTTVDRLNTVAGAGISMFANASTAGACFGWIQIGGFATVANAFGGPPVAGNTLSNIGAAAGVMQLVAAATSPVVGITIVVAAKQVNLTYPR